MIYSTKLVITAAILSLFAIGLTLATSRNLSTMFLFLFSCLGLALCYCFHECRWASIFALLNFIMAVNAFDLVGLIIIGSKFSLTLERHWGGPFTTVNVCGILLFIIYATLSFIGWLLYKEFFKQSAQPGQISGQGAMFNNGNSTGVYGHGEYDNW